MKTEHSTGYDIVRIVEKQGAYTVYLKQFEWDNPGTESKWKWSARFRCLDHALSWIDSPEVRNIILNHKEK